MRKATDATLDAFRRIAMKEARLFIALMLLLAAAPLSALTTEKTPGTKAPETAQQKKQYEKSMEERLRKIGRELDELKGKAANMTEEARKEMNRYLEDAEKKQKAASRKLEEMRRESQKKWKEFTDEMDAAMDELDKAYAKAKAHLKK
jgi:DNA anti-recombination protein RmuC